MVNKAAKDALTDPISADMKKVIRQLKLSPMLDTLPERLALARQQHLSHAAFLELVLADEATRRDTSSAARRARAAGLDPAMRIASWDDHATVRYDRTVWTDLTSLRFLGAAHGAVILGAVGVGKTHLATALGHIAVRRRIPTLMLRADAMFKRLRASRLDNSTDPSQSSGWRTEAAVEAEACLCVDIGVRRRCGRGPRYAPPRRHPRVRPSADT